MPNCLWCATPDDLEPVRVGLDGQETRADDLTLTGHGGETYRLAVASCGSCDRLSLFLVSASDPEGTIQPINASLIPRDDLDQLMAEVLRFRDARDWEQFHTPRNLAAAIAIEAAELQELMLWKTSSEVERLLEDPSRREDVEDEIADVLIFTLLMAEAVGIDPAAAIRAKLEKNERKYPVERSRGRAEKYDRLSAEEDR